MVIIIAITEKVCQPGGHFGPLGGGNLELRPRRHSSSPPPQQNFHGDPACHTFFCSSIPNPSCCSAFAVSSRTCASSVALRSAKSLRIWDTKQITTNWYASCARTSKSLQRNAFLSFQTVSQICTACLNFSTPSTAPGAMYAACTDPGRHLPGPTLVVQRLLNHVAPLGGQRVLEGAVLPQQRVRLGGGQDEALRPPPGGKHKKT